MATAQPATVTQIIDDSPIGAFQRRVFLFCILISVLDGFDTQAIAFVAPAIARDWAISQWHFGFLFSATLLGSVIGSLACGALADRYGRRRMVIVTVAMFGLFSAACALATGYWQLLAFRLLGGIGMGGVIPNMLALTAEYAPARKRASLVTLTLWGFPLGAVLGGIVSGPLIERLGWESVFWLGAAAPLLLVPVLAGWLPESLGFLAVSGERRDAIVALLRKIDPRRADSVVIAPPPATTAQHSPMRALFAPGLAPKTIFLSAMMFSSLFLTYLLINWVPTMLVQTGMPVSKAILGAVGLNLGGVIGSAFLSRAIDRGADPRRLLATGFVCGAVTIALAGSLFGGTAAIVLLMACGLFHIGSQLSSSAFITNSYPVEMRASGIGFNQGIGRLGSLVGPVAGGALLSAGLTTAQMFRLAVIPALLCAGALIALAIVQRGSTSKTGERKTA
jgi:AAHS family 4-hydroxybenzoate transporter-like MFS transporter